MRALARVSTERPERYAKQLASHLGRKCEVRESPEGPIVLLAGGQCLLASRGDVLELCAEAPGEDVLERVKDVVGRHLERFGAKDGLVVAWDR